jgi:hypothetical protein
VVEAAVFLHEDDDVREIAEVTVPASHAPET